MGNQIAMQHSDWFKLNDQLVAPKPIIMVVMDWSYMLLKCYGLLKCVDKS